MRKIRPYRTVQGAARALDNGGRFFNLLTQAGDDRIDAAELARAAGALSAGRNAFLHLEMALMALSPADKANVLARLTPELRTRYAQQRPAVLAPSAVSVNGQKGTPTIVTGYPVFVEDKTEFKGFIVMVTPIIMLIPIFDQYDVYQVYDTPARREPRTVIATTRGSKRLDQAMTRFGGLLREFEYEDPTGRRHDLYLETVYYTPLASPAS